MIIFQASKMTASQEAVTPAEAGVQERLLFLDSRFHGNDRKERFRSFYKRVNLQGSIGIL
jgi:hypothetical protein